MNKLSHLLLALCLAAAPLSAKDADGKKKKGPNKKREVIEVCFVLDTTGSMGGLIEGAKQKIWSISNEILASEPTPDLRIALIGYRDRSDAYVTKIHDLSEDLDDVYANLMKFQAQGGGDTPESVNQALHESVTKIKWDKSRDVLKLVFLVGDAPPHMDYQDDVKYPEVCKLAVKKDLVVNSVQCGNMASTTPIWKEIAKLAEGDYVVIAQTGGVAAISTPVDAEIARINRELGGTVEAYGDSRLRTRVSEKVELAKKADEEVAADRLAALSLKSKASSVYLAGRSGAEALDIGASAPATASGFFSASFIDGEGDLVDGLLSGRYAYDKLEEDKFTEKLKKMKPAERKAYLEKQVAKRRELQKRLDELLVERRKHVETEKARLAKEGKSDGFDSKVSEIISKRRR